MVRGVPRRVRGTLEANGDWEVVSDLAELELELASDGEAHRLRLTADAADLRGAVDTLVAEARGLP